MAFSVSDLVALSSGNGRTIHLHDQSADTLATVSAADYYLPAYRQLGVNDLIFVIASDDQAVLRVTASTSSTVTTTTYPSGVASFGPSAVTSITVRNGIVTAIS